LLFTVGHGYRSDCRLERPGTPGELGRIQGTVDGVVLGRLDLGVGLSAERTLAGLTPRELEVLRLLVEGRSNRQIAETLVISGKTASVCVTNLLAKLGVHSRLEAAATARHLGLDQPAQEDAAT
jgi:DNA-binding NarL/FixJ family response regulator